jgi:hypothetical protein
MELPLPSGVASLTKNEKYEKSTRQVFWLSDQPENVSLPAGFLSPGSGRLVAATFSVPDYSGGTAPDSHRVPDCLGVSFLLD